MSRSILPIALCAIALVLGLSAAPSPAAAAEKFGDAEFKCVGDKQKAASRYAESTLEHWAAWETSQNGGKRDTALAREGGKLASAFAEYEAVSLAADVDCVEQTVGAAELEGRIAMAVAGVVAAINSGLDLGNASHRQCGAALLDASAKRIGAHLKAEGKHTTKVPDGGDAAKRAATQQAANAAFSAAWAAAACPTAATEAGVASQLDAIRDDTVYRTVVSPVLDDSQFQPVSPVGPIEYQGMTLHPRCGFDANPNYHFFVKRGSVNKVVMYYQGGGACWENLTCGIPVCKNSANPIADDPDNAQSGFGNLGNPANPFKDWNIVFVTYCTCDIHFGDVDQNYPGPFGPGGIVSVKHRGFQNAKVAEKFAREHFLNPEVVFATGSSAGAYGAIFHGPLLHEAWPVSKINVLADAGNGVITPSFQMNEFQNWNFAANLPADIPGVVESLTSGEGTVAYVEAVASFFPETTWAHYSTSFDGGSGGQSGFYNIMLNGNNPLASLTWWQAACPFNAAMTSQAFDTFDRVPSNYRYYIGAGSRHTMYGNNKVYTDQSGGESQTIVDWVKDMIAFEPGISPPGDWSNVECTDCTRVLAGDPRPPVIPTPPFFDVGGQVRVVCP